MAYTGSIPVIDHTPKVAYTGSIPAIDHTPKATLLCSKIVSPLSFLNTVMIRMGGGSDLGVRLSFITVHLLPQGFLSALQVVLEDDT